MPFDVLHDGPDGDAGEDLAAVQLGAPSEFEDAVFEEFLIRLVEPFPELDGLAVDDAAVHDLHEVDVAGRRVAHHAVDLHVVDAGVDHAALGLEFLQRHLLAFVRLGLFEGEGGGGVLHGLVIGSDEVLEVAAEDVADRVHAFVVVLLALLADARGLAVAHVVLEARPEFAGVDVLSLRSYLHVRTGWSFRTMSRTACMVLTEAYGPKYSEPFG